MDDRMANSLDNFITGHYGEDQYKDLIFCRDCIHYEAGHCLSDKSAYEHKPMNEEDFCDEAETYDPRDDEPDLEEDE